MNIQGSNFLVVGASGVLGQEFCKALIDLGANVYATARTNESAANIPEGVTQKLLLDLESSESIKTLTGYLNASLELAGVIVAAGRVAFGPASETPAELDVRLMNINYFGPRNLLVDLEPNLGKSDSSYVLNVTGVVAQTPMPTMSSYSASKSAIHGFLTSVQREWRRAGIKVKSELLGHTETGLANRPLSGRAPALPQGLDPKVAVKQMLDELLS